MATQILRPVLTFDQVLRLPDPYIEFPDRIIEVSKPDPNVFMNEHFNGVLKQNADIHGHTAHAMDTRMAAAEFGVPMDTMRGMQHAADSAANSAAMASGNRDLGAAPMDTSGSAAPPPAAPAATPAASSAQFDYVGKQNMVE